MSCRWYPPGHGDFYQSFLDSGLLESLEEGGRKYAFISNVDNMAGITDLRILNKIVKERTDFALEVTKTTQADVKERAFLTLGFIGAIQPLFNFTHPICHLRTEATSSTICQCHTKQENLRISVLSLL